MIVRMKKLTLLCMASEKDATLEALRKLGVLHVSSVNPPEGKSLDETRAFHERVEKTLSTLSALLPAGLSTESLPASGVPLAKAEEVVEEVSTFMRRKKELVDALEKLKLDEKKIEPFGDFNPAAIKALAQSGVSVSLYHASPKGELTTLEGAVVQVIRRDKGRVYFAVIARGDIGGDIPAGWEVFRLPEMSLREVRERVSEIEHELGTIEAGVHQLAEKRSLVEKLLLKSEADVDFLEVSSGMGAAGTISYLQGFCPKHALGEVRAAAAEQGWGILVEDPGPDDSVPTLLLYPKWVKPMKALFETINILPGYREIDVSAVFLLFFSVFFAMIVGDAGYGLLFLALTLVARLKLKRAPSYPFFLLGTLSICTIAWGILTGNYFGISSVPAPLEGLKIDWLNDRSHVMELCFLIGAVHLSIAHIWNAIRIINTPQAIAQVGWICITWTMFMAARGVVCSVPFPLPGGLILGGVGLAAVVLFMTPPRQLKSKVINHAMLPLSVVSNFVDVVSYVRLFAVGMASLSVAQNFNHMALSLGFSRLWAAPISALILLAGHSLNILLCALGVLVHGVRLNTLEFSNHIGLQWSGFKYNPFRMKTAGARNNSDI